MKPYYEDQAVTLYQGDALEVLEQLTDESVQCVVTSPPYWSLRDYGVDGQIGLEATPSEFVDRMVEVFAEVHRVLRSDGTLWLNFGDSYSHGGTELKPKDLMGMPWHVAFALQEFGWWLRSDIIWSKPSPMPESVTDRPTKAHEYIFLLSKSAQYLYDAEAVKTPSKRTGLMAIPDGWETGDSPHDSVSHSRRERNPDKQRGHSRRHAGFNDRWDGMSKKEQQENGANLRSVWTVASHRFPGAHFATFPPKLIEPCVLAGCAEGGVVLDPFVGSGTTCMVAQCLGRRSIGIDINEQYLAMAVERCSQKSLWFSEAAS